ncbi:MAG: hypothetical protein M0Q92_13890 [Methanoregula sp.]|jgi:hypothetical protein|nr:hypothetical protein [Methanoregula sp.]
MEIEIFTGDGDNEIKKYVPLGAYFVLLLCVGFGPVVVALFDRTEFSFALPVAHGMRRVLAGGVNFFVFGYFITRGFLFENFV